MAKPKAPSLEKLSMIDSHGERRYIYPADVRGRFNRIKPFVYGFLILLYIGLPFLEVGGDPAVWIDIPRRQFYLFGNTFNAQDFYLAFFLASGVAFTLILVSALWGRIWCGWACPQTVFLDGVFRRIETWIEGPANRRRRLAAGPWNREKILKKGLKHLIYIALALFISHVFVAYFLSTGGVVSMWTEGPSAHPVGFGWALVMSALLYFNFWWFREQLCIVICPYGRLQSVLGDDDTLVIGYDAGRGEPRGKASDESAGDCVDCGRCVAVCPTGIDIRNGLQLECIGCANCIDACDQIMDKVGRPRGLIRYDSQRGLTEGERRFWRPRVLYYALAGLVGLVVAVVAFSGRTPFEANLLRTQGVPFEISDTTVQNDVLVHVTNKNPEPSTFTVEPDPAHADWMLIPQRQVTLEPFSGHKFPVVIRVPRASYAHAMELRLRVDDSASGTSKDLAVKVLGPRKLRKRSPQ